MTVKRSGIRSFVWICALMYFTSYITRNSYGSAIVEITDAMGAADTMMGLVSTSAFLTYGVGQILCGVIGDYVAPRKMILIGMLVTSICNILMPVMGDVPPMIVLWGINGFAQSMLWPPLVRLLAEHLSREEYNNAVVTVSMGSSIGNILVYILSPVCIYVSGWRLIFYICGGAGILMSAAWIWKTRSLPAPVKVTAEPKQEGEDETPVQTQKMPVGKIIAMSGLVSIAGAIILQGMLRDGLTTWMPTLLSDTFSLPSTVSILTGVVLPLFAIVSFKIAAWVQNKLHNEVLCAAVFFGGGLACALLMLPLFSRSAVLSVLLTALITACMHGVNLMLITRVPIYFARFGKISTMSGVLNAFTYIGSAVSTYGFALLSEKFGWYFTIGSWAITAGLGMILCLCICRRWKQFSKE